MAEALFRKFSSGAHSVNSVCLSVGNNEGQRIGDLASATHVLRAMEEVGIDLKDAKKKQLNHDNLNQYDKIISMVAHTLVPEVLQNNPRVTFWDVADPFEKDLDFTREIRDLILKHTQELIAELK